MRRNYFAGIRLYNELQLGPEAHHGRGFHQKALGEGKDL
jgi:hypothetical protein